jgi:D-alanyl-D-alanine carboxypeptidase
VNSKINIVMEGFVDPNGPGAAVGVCQGDDPPHVDGFGLADLEWGIPITPDTVFRIGSLTKQFTAAAILLLAEDGKLQIDDPIQSVLPDYPGAERGVTIRHLLTHTSGIQNFNTLPTFPERTDLTAPEIIELFKNLPPNFAPGERLAFCNSGFVLLGAIIEAVSGMAYRTFLLERIFRPLGMRQTRYLYDEPIVPKRARGYSVGAKGIRNARTLSMTLPYAAYGLGSTVEDLLTWRHALRNGQVISAQSYAAMIAPTRLNDGSLIDVGFGQLDLRYRDRTAITHGGGINGFSARMTQFPEDDLIVVVLSNLDTFPTERAHLALARTALALPDLPAQPRIDLPEQDLVRCAGVYEMDDGFGRLMPFTIRSDAGALVAPFPTPQSRYEPFAATGFQYVVDPEFTLHFEQQGDAGFERMTIEGPMRSPSQGPTLAYRAARSNAQ